VTDVDLGALTWSFPDGERPLRMVVLADSTAFIDHTGPQLPETPHLYPNVAARHLEQALARPGGVVVIARAGTTIRDVHRTVTKDRHVMFDVLRGADAVVVGFGGFDHAPGGIPPMVDAMVPYLRPSGVRRQVRRILTAAYPWVVRASRRRMTRTHPGMFDRLYDDLFVHVRGLTLGAPGVALGPTSHHRSPFYARRAPRHRQREADQLAIASRHQYATQSVWDLVSPFGDDFNVDCIHWPPPAHAAVGRAVADLLLEQFTGRAPLPGIPGVAERHYA
jgi:diglucosylglycerate octanoyltransferase